MSKFAVGELVQFEGKPAIVDAVRYDGVRGEHFYDLKVQATSGWVGYTPEHTLTRKGPTAADERAAIARMVKRRAEQWLALARDPETSDLPVGKYVPHDVLIALAVDIEAGAHREGGK